MGSPGSDEGEVGFLSSANPRVDIDACVADAKSPSPFSIFVELVVIIGFGEMEMIFSTAVVFVAIRGPCS